MFRRPNTLSRYLNRPSLLIPHHFYLPATTVMSTTGALHTSASLKADNAPRYDSMQGKLDPTILDGLKAMDFEFMTPVQAKVLNGLPSLKSDW